jgi:hypothetical protein
MPTAAAPRPTVDALVDATPASRDRAVDLLRAVAIGVVVLWHWVFSVTHWSDDGQLTMPNPIGDVPGLWLVTWLLQVMPLAVLQLGVALWVRAPLNRWLQRRGPWRAVVALNGVAMTVFCWHMTALLLALVVWEAGGGPLAAGPTAAWWALRPVWLVPPGRRAP